MQASEKAYGAVFHAAKGYGELRGWNHFNHYRVGLIYDQLSDEESDLTLSSDFGIIESLHNNFLEYELPTNRVRGGLDVARNLVERLDTLSNAQPNALPSSSLNREPAPPPQPADAATGPGADSHRRPAAPGRFAGVKSPPCLPARWICTARPGRSPSPSFGISTTWRPAATPMAACSLKWCTATVLPGREDGCTPACGITWSDRATPACFPTVPVKLWTATPGHTLVTTLKPLPAAGDDLADSIWEFCAHPQSHRKVMNRFRRHGDPQVQKALRELQGQKRLKSVTVGREKGYQAV